VADEFIKALPAKKLDEFKPNLNLSRESVRICNRAFVS
jgi:hypothetical protein